MGKFQVTAAAPPQQVPDPAAALNRGMETGVLVPLAQNTAGGLATAVFIEAAGWLAAGRPDVMQSSLLADLAPWAIAAGVLVLAGATIVRAFRDEVAFLVAAWGERHDQAQQAALQRRIEELDKLLQEAKQAGVLSGEFAVKAAAEKLLTWLYDDGLSISRQACMSRGMTRPDWEHASEALRNAGVLGDKGQLLAADSADGWRRFMRYINRSGKYVRTADGGFAKV